MRLRGWISTVLMAAVLWSPSVWAQQKHIADAAALERAVAKKIADDNARRQAVRAVLSDPRVREVAERFGLSVQRAETAVAGLSSAELAELQAPTRALQAELAGGDQTIVISLTTLLLIIIIVLLIAD